MKRRTLLASLGAAPLLAAVPVAAVTGAKTASSNRKSSLNAYSFNRPLRDGEMDLFALADYCAGLGFDAIDPTGYYFPGYPAAPPDEFINSFKRHVFLCGLDISGTGVRNDFVDPDPHRRAASREHVREWIGVAARLGSPNLRVFTGKSAHDGFSRDQVLDWMAEDFLQCSRWGEEHGVMIALQNHNEFLRTAAEVDELFERVNSDWFGLNLDIGSYRHGDPYSEIERNVARAVTWQIKENVWIGGVETPTDFERLAGIVKSAGYRGYLPLETLAPGDPRHEVPELLEKTRAAGLYN